MKEFNRNFSDEPLRKDIPEPIIIEEQSNQNNTDKSVDCKKKHNVISFFIFYPMENQIAQLVPLELQKNLLQHY